MKLEQIKRLNRKLDEITDQEKDDVNIVNEVFRGFFDHKETKELDEKTAALLLTYKKAPESLKGPQKEYARHLAQSHQIDEVMLVDRILPNKEAFFLCAVARDKKILFDEIEGIAKSYNLTTLELSSLREKGFIDWLTRDEFKRLSEHPEKLSQQELSSFKERGFIDFLTEKESYFVSSIVDECTKHGSLSLLAKRFAFGVDEKRLEVIRRSFLDILNNEESEFIQTIKVLEDNIILPAKEYFQITDERYFDLKKRLSFHSKNEIKAIDFSWAKPDEKKFLLDLQKAPSKSVEELADEHSLDGENLKKALSRVSFFKGNEIKSVDLNNKARYEIKIDQRPVRYKEHEALLKLRESKKSDYAVSLSASDYALIIKGIRNDTFHRKEQERLSEIKSFLDLDKVVMDIPSNKELAFLNKLKGRNFDLDRIIKIAKDDFGISDEVVHGLLKTGFFTEDKGKIRINWNDPLFEERTWISAQRLLPEDERHKILSNLRIEKPIAKLLDIVEIECQPMPFKPKTIDYEIYFKILRCEQLTKFEEIRLRELRINGIHPESKEYKEWVHTKPKSYSRMQQSRRDAFLNHYENLYGVPYEVLHWVNTFKQVPDELIRKFGIGLNIMDRSANVLNMKGETSDKYNLLEKHTHNSDQGKITYYSLSHTDLISGRKFLEKRLEKSEIFKSPQRRQDCLYHDLQVPLCVFEVKKELEANKKKIVAIKNESKQFAEDKTGKQNHERDNEHTFMDAIIIIEEEAMDSQSRSSGGGKTIAVEYGNYSHDRMQHKIDQSSFDEAYIFAKPEYIAMYQKRIITHKTIHYRVWQ